MSHPRSATLDPADREFCELVSRAAFSNPFGGERDQLYGMIDGYAPRLSPVERQHLVAHAVSAGVRRFEAAGKADVRLYSGEERYRMQSVFLFEIYHQFFESLDQLILDQIKAGETPCTVPFAADALTLLQRRGFTRTESLRFFASFYQLRRAHHFITRGLIGQSACMREFRRRLWNNVFTHDIRLYDRYLWNRMEDFSTLLLGETGAGKGAAAAAIGRSGFIPFDEKKRCFAESFTRSFVSLNLSQYPETLIESELFGHRKGAFTGAVEAHDGVFARCSPNGAIFLDEIGEVSVPVQIKLLQVVQERTFSPVGSHDVRRFNGRVIAATNRPLHKLRGEGGIFRDDFYYRLCSDTITVPPLRQRLGEDPHEKDALLEHVIARMTGEEARELVELVSATLDECVDADYPWPGNVRELEQATRRILLTRRYDPDDRAAAPSLRSELAHGMECGSLDADALLSGYCAVLYERFRSYEEVARRTKLDRRTVKKYIEQGRCSAI